MLTSCNLEMDFSLGSLVNDVLKKILDAGHVLASFSGSVLGYPFFHSSFVGQLCVPKLET